VPAAEPIRPQEIIHINTEARRLGVIAQPSTYDGCLVTFPARAHAQERARPHPSGAAGVCPIAGVGLICAPWPLARPCFGEGM
jgi:hypothetical protein